MLTPIRHGRLRDLEKIDYGNPKACRVCSLRAQCTNDVRSVARLENEDVLDRMAERLKAKPQILDRRREVVEHPFGSIKQWMNQGAFLMRGLENGRAEFSLTALVYNSRRVLNILGVGDDRGALRVKTDVALARSAPPEPVQGATGSTQAPLQAKKPKRGVSRAQVCGVPQRKQFPHGLLDFCTSGNVCKQTYSVRSPSRPATPASCAQRATGIDGSCSLTRPPDCRELSQELGFGRTRVGRLGSCSGRARRPRQFRNASPLRARSVLRETRWRWTLKVFWMTA